MRTAIAILILAAMTSGAMAGEAMYIETDGNVGTFEPPTNRLLIVGGLVTEVCPVVTNELILYFNNTVPSCTNYGPSSWGAITNGWDEPTDITIATDGWTIHTEHGEYVVTNGLIKTISEDAEVSK